ncbi:fungal-specific transcription factor domain-containing protein [Xylariales sp. PMI_506]|nr:fungal-specific transcription factor domain-containing protein [Xylariales sp. PMI_506]
MESSPGSRVARPRQSTACNWCRSHKLRCDAQQPRCQNCHKRGLECVTTDLRRPGSEGQRLVPLGRHKRRTLSSPAARSVASGGVVETASTSPGLAAGPFDQVPRSPGGRPSANNLTLVTDESGSLQQVITSGSSLYALVQWLDLFFSKKAGWQPTFPNFLRGLGYSFEVSLPSGAPLPELPSPSQVEQYASAFFARIYPILPIIVKSAFVESVERLRQTLASKLSLPSGDYPALALAYAVFSVCADEAEGQATILGTSYLEGAYGLLAHLIVIPNITCVQALLMLAFSLRNRNKDGASWGILGHAIRIAQSMGLHRFMSASAETADLYARIWWACYVLERTMQLETGRPSAIRDDECDQIMPVAEDGNPYFSGLVSLARIQTRIIDLFYIKTNSHRSVKQMLLDMGKTDRSLLDWAGGFPESIRPGRDLMCGSEELHLATYLNLHYHQTMIALHRPALMSELYWLQNQITEHCSNTPWGHRLRFSLCIGAASARAILKSLNDLLLYSRVSRIIIANQTLLATLVLGIYVTKVPESLMNDSDLAMIATYADKMEREYTEMGQDTDFAKGIIMLQRQLSEQVRLARPRDHSSAFQPEFDLGTLDDTWPLLWSEDWGNYISNADDNTLSMYLLGLPQSNTT